MPLETLEDVIENIADWCRVYGVHDDENDAACDTKPCRVCFTDALRTRLDAAYELEAILKRGSRELTRR